jgi:hypothetical protein
VITQSVLRSGRGGRVVGSNDPEDDEFLTFAEIPRVACGPRHASGHLDFNAFDA